MGIYIKGIEMPTMEQAYTALCIGWDGKVYKVNLTRDKHMPDATAKAVPVPAHGRTIDEDALWVKINKICDRRDAGIITDLTCLQQILSAVRHAPTIIPAEG